MGGTDIVASAGFEVVKFIAHKSLTGLRPKLGARNCLIVYSLGAYGCSFRYTSSIRRVETEPIGYYFGQQNDDQTILIIRHL